MTKVTFSRANVKQLNGEQLLNSILVATQGKPERNTIRTVEMVGSLYPAGAIWCEVTPLPGNARQALLLRNNSQVASWINAVASLAGSPPWRPFIPFQASTVCLVRSV